MDIGDRIIKKHNELNDAQRWYLFLGIDERNYWLNRTNFDTTIEDMRRDDMLKLYALVTKIKAEQK